MGRAGHLSTPTARAAAAIKMRAKAEIEEGPPKGDRIVVTEIPYQTSVEAIEEKIAELVRTPAPSRACARSATNAPWPRPTW